MRRDFMTEFKPIRILNRIPGALSYKGRIESVFAIDMIVYNKEHIERESFSSVETCEKYIEAIEGEETVWLNVTGLNNVEEINMLGMLFDMPTNILEQIVNVSRQSNFRMTPDWIYSVFQMIYLHGDKIEFEHLGIFTEGRFVLTFQEKEGDVFDSVRERMMNALGHIRSKKADYLYYSLLDAMVDNYLDVMEKIKYDINLMEEAIIEEERVDAKAIHALRKSILMLRMTTSETDRLLGRIALGSGYTFTTTDQYYLDSLSDHNRELVNELSLQREVVNALFENHMLNNSNDMNTIMTTLTIFSAIFIPLSFLAGIFGMNFLYMPGLDYAHGFALFIGICLTIVAVMITLFKVKRWF